MFPNRRRQSQFWLRIFKPLIPQANRILKKTSLGIVLVLF